MRFFIILILLIYISYTSTAQVVAIEEDSILNEYHINYPLDAGALYHSGDTVVATYYEPVTFWEDLHTWLLGKPPLSTGRLKGVYVIRAIVKDIDSMNVRHIPMGLKLKIYSIEYHKETITALHEYRTSRGCLLKLNTEQWYDVHDWQNVTGLYRIRRFIDNYQVGDTLYRTYFTETSLVGELLGTGRSTLYLMEAIVKDIDTINQTLLLELLQIRKPFARRSMPDVQPDKDSMVYNYEMVHKHDLVWTKPYYWFKRGQYAHIKDATIPALAQYIYGCGSKVYEYGCDGNKYTISQFPDRE